MQPIARHFEEKRQYIRMQIDAPAQVITEDGITHHVTCVDLSSHGIQLESSEAFAQGDTGEFLLAPGGGPITPLHARFRILRVKEVSPHTYRAGATLEALS